MCIRDSLGAYQLAISLALDNALDTTIDIQGLIATVNAEQAAIAASNAAITAVSAAAASSDASALTITQLNGIIGLTDEVAANLEAYKTAIALVATAGELDDVAEIQTLIATVNGAAVVDGIVQGTSATATVSYTHLRAHET